MSYKDKEFFSKPNINQLELFNSNISSLKKCLELDMLLHNCNGFFDKKTIGKVKKKINEYLDEEKIKNELEELDINLLYGIPIFLDRYSFDDELIAISLIELVKNKKQHSSLLINSKKLYKNNEKLLNDFISTSKECTMIIVSFLEKKVNLIDFVINEKILNENICSEIDSNFFSLSEIDRILKLNDNYISELTKVKLKQKINHSVQQIVSNNAFEYSIEVLCGEKFPKNIEIIHSNKNGSFQFLKKINFSKIIFKYLGNYKNFLSILKDLCWISDGRILLVNYSEDSLLNIMTYNHDKSFIKNGDFEFLLKNQTMKIEMMRLIKYYESENNNYLKTLDYILGNEIGIPFFTGEDFIDIIEINSYNAKNKLLCILMDSILRQFYLFSKYEKISMELMNEISTFSFTNIKSTNSKKNIYSNNFEINELFKSKNSGVYFTYLYKSDYDNIYDLLLSKTLIHSTILSKDKHLYQYLEKLIGELLIVDNDIVIIKDHLAIKIYKYLYENGFLIYGIFDDEKKRKIDEMIDKKKLLVDDNLFSKPEIEMLNYFLNNQQFSDNLALRNRYLHSAIHYDEEKHIDNYFTLVMILTLIIGKIDNDIKLFRSNNEL